MTVPNAPRTSQRAVRVRIPFDGLRYTAVGLLVGCLLAPVGALRSAAQEPASDALELLSAIPLGASYSLSVQGRNAYVTGNDGVLILDVADPRQPVVAGEISVEGGALGITVIGDRAFVAGAKGLFLVVDVTNPGRARQVSAHALTGMLRNVEVRGSTAYLAGRDLGLVILDVSNAASPVKIGDFRGGGRVRGVQVLGDYAFLAGMEEGVEIIDVSAPSSPRKVASLRGMTGARALLVTGRRLFVGLSTGGVKVFDLADPASPTLVQELLPGEEVSGLSSAGGRLCVSLSRGLVSVFDVSDLASPRELGAYQLDEGLHDVVCRQQYLYALAFHGLAVFALPKGRSLRTGDPDASAFALMRTCGSWSFGDVTEGTTDVERGPCDPFARCCIDAVAGRVPR